MSRSHAGLVVLIALAFACQTVPSSPAPSVALGVGAATSAQPLLDDAMNAYGQQAGHVTFAPEYGDARLVLDGLRAGRYEGALVTWPRAASQLPDDLWAQPVALDALAVIVHKDNPQAGLGIAELREIFQGRTNTWPAGPGGDALPIAVVTREDGANARALFERAVMGDQKVTLTAAIMPTSRDVVEYVAGHPGAIGYVSLAWVDSSVRALAVDGVAPSPESARDQSYPLLAPVYFFSKAEPQGELRAFYLYLIGPQGQAVVARKYGPVK